MNLANSESPHTGTVACVLARPLLKALWMMTADGTDAEGLDRIQLVPRQSLLIAANADAMLWVRHRFANPSEPFTLSRELCGSALKWPLGCSEQFNVRVSETQAEGRREIALSARDRLTTEIESLVPYPDPRAVLAVRPDREEVDFQPEHLATLRTAMALVADQRDLPVHVARRGRAPAFVVCPIPTVVGIIAPWSDSRGGRRWTGAALKEFALEPFEATQPPRPEALDAPLRHRKSIARGRRANGAAGRP